VSGVEQEQDNMNHAEIAESTSSEYGKTFQVMLVAVGDSLNDLASSDDGEDGEEEEDEETEQGKLSEDEEPGWVMGTIFQTVQQRRVRYRQKQTKFKELTHPGWEYAADYFRERDKK